MWATPTVNHCSRPFFVSCTHLSSTPFLFFLGLPYEPGSMAKTVWSSSSAEEDTFVMTFARRNLNIARVYVFSLSLLFPSLIRSLEGTRIDESWNSFFFSCCIIKSLEMYRLQLASYIFLQMCTILCAKMKRKKDG